MQTSNYFMASDRACGVLRRQGDIGRQRSSWQSLVFRQMPTRMCVQSTEALAFSFMHA